MGICEDAFDKEEFEKIVGADFGNLKGSNIDQKQ